MLQTLQVRWRDGSQMVHYFLLNIHVNDTLYLLSSIPLLPPQTPPPLSLDFVPLCSLNLLPPPFFSFLHSLFLPLTPPLISLFPSSFNLRRLPPPFSLSPSHSFSVLPSSFRPMDNRLSPPYSTQWVWLCSGRRYALPRWRMQQPVQSELRGLLQPGER